MTEAHCAPPGPAASRALRIFAALTAVCAALAIAAGPAQGAALPPFETGVSYVLANEEPAVALEHVRATGAKLAQAPVRWSEVAPRNQPAVWQPDDPADSHYDWDRIDRWVTAAVLNGIMPVLQIRSAPTWAQGCEPSQIDTGAPCNPDPAALAAFATAAARRYNGQFGGLPRVQYWQGLNEPNLSLYFNPQYIGDKPASPTLYRALINSFYAAIKADDSSNLVIAAGLGPIAVPKLTIGPMRFTRLLLCMTGGVKHPRPTKGDCGGGVNFDIFDIHPFTTGGPTHKGGGNEVQMGDLNKLKTLLRAADKAGRINSVFPQTPLWITEFSWDSKPPDSTGLPMKTLTRWAAEAMHQAWQAGVHTFFWFSLRDSPLSTGEEGATMQSGLYFRGATVAEDQPKKVLNAFRFPFVAYPGEKGLSFWGRTPTSKNGKVVIQARLKGHWKTVAVTQAGKNGVFRGKDKTLYGRNKKGAVRARYRGETSVPFAMRGVPDFPQPPFGLL